MGRPRHEHPKVKGGQAGLTRGRRANRRATIAIASGLSTLNHYRLPGGASRLAALLIAYLCPIRSLFAACDPGAALRQSALIQHGQATSGDIRQTAGRRAGVGARPRQAQAYTPAYGSAAGRPCSNLSRLSVGLPVK